MIAGGIEVATIKKQPLAPTVLGVVFIFIGVICNVWLMTGLFSPYADSNAVIESFFFNAVVWAFDIVIILCALLVILLRSKPFIISFSKNALLAVTSMFMVLLGFELLFPYALPVLPLELQPYVNYPYRVLCQSSKASVVPKDYIAIVGDSYAHGYGDWLMATDHWRNDPFNSAHLLNQQLDVDVISFGKSGASSISGLIEQPVTGLKRLRHRFDIADPAVILVYFYEGNDLPDNLHDLHYRSPNYFEYAGVDTLDRSTFMTYVSTSVLSQGRFEVSRSKVLGISFIMNLGYNAIDRLRGADPSAGIVPETWPRNPSYNIARIDGKDHNLPERLQGPACQLSDEEISLALGVFDLSLRFLKREYADSRVAVVYIPSVVSCYNWGDSVSVENPEEAFVWGKMDPDIFTSELARDNSDKILQLVGAICSDNNVAFINCREPMRIATRKEAIHGPRDWKHLNLRGYELLAQSVSHFISTNGLLKR